MRPASAGHSRPHSSIRTASAITCLLVASGGGGGGGGACNDGLVSAAGAGRVAFAGDAAGFGRLVLAAADFEDPPAVRAGGVVFARCTADGGVAPLRCAAAFGLL